MSQDNRNKTMFGRSPFHVDDDGAKVAVPVAPAAPPDAAAELGFDEDGWDFDEPSVTGSQAAAASSSSVVPDAASALAAPMSAVFESSVGAEALDGAVPSMEPASDEALSGVPMGQHTPEAQPERAFTGTMRFRAEDLAGLAGLAVGAASSPESSETERPMSGTVRLSRHEMDAALAAVSAPVPSAPLDETPVQDAPVQEAPRALGGTIRFRPEDMAEVFQARAERTAGNRTTVEAPTELAESLRAQTLSDEPEAAISLAPEAGSDPVPAELSPASEPDAGETSSGSAGGGTEAPVPEPGRPVWGTIPIMIDDIPQLFQAHAAAAAGDTDETATPDAAPDDADETATPDAAPPVATDGLPTAFTATIAMGTQDVLNALAKVTAEAANNSPPAASAPADAAAFRAPLPPRVEGETAGLLRDLAPATRSAAPPATIEKTGPPVVAIALGVLVLGVIAVVLYLFVL